MNVAERAKATYGQNAARIISNRAAEHEALARISHKLRATAARASVDFAAFASALHENVKLWTIFAADVAHSDNHLPIDLRARIIWLSEFVNIETRKLLKGEGDIAVLVEINAAVLMGLRGEEQ